MRLIQYSVAQAILKPLAAGKNKNSSEENEKKITEYEKALLETLPPDTSARIEWLQGKKIINLSKEEACQLRVTYETLIVWYSHLQAQVDKVTDKTINHITVDKNQLATTLQDALTISEKLLKSLK